MKEKLILIVLLLGSHILFAQVGINKEVPDATLDIKAKTEDGSKPEGLLIPRLTAAEVKIMTETPNVVGTAQEGLTVYVTAPFTDPSTDQTGKYELIDGKGYYYYDSTDTKWKKLLDTNSKPTGLEKIVENGNPGWRYIGVNPDLYDNTGWYSSDLQVIPTEEEGAKEVPYLQENTGDGSNHIKSYNQIKEEIKSYYRDFDYDYTAYLHKGQIESQAALTQFDKLGARGNNSFVAGIYNVTDSLGSAAIGVGNKAVGNFSFAAGNKALAMSYGSIAMGFEASSLYVGSVAIGSNVKVASKNAVAIGTNLIADIDGEVVLGTSNTIRSSERGRLFTIGNGSDEYRFPATSTSRPEPYRSDAFSVLRNARVGIDIDNFEKAYTDNNSIGHIYDAKLQVNGLIQSRGILGADGASAAKVVVADEKGVFKTVDRSAIQGSSDNIYTTDGEIPAGIARTVTMADNAANITLTREGTNTSPLLIANGTIKMMAANMNSDARLKTNVTDLSSDKINNLRAVSYVWNEEGKKRGGNDKLQYGFIAQELEKVYPNLVSTDKDGYKSVNYIQVIPVLTKALQEEKATTKALKKEVSELKESLKSQDKRIEELEKAIQKLLNK